MFNNIIYFLIVLVVFSIYPPDKKPDYSFLYFISMLLFCWLVFSYTCWSAFKSLLKRSKNHPGANGLLSKKYQTLVSQFSMLAVLLFAIDLFLLDLKYWIYIIPGADQYSVLGYIIALGFYIFYLSTIWFFAHGVYSVSHGVGISRSTFLVSNIRLNTTFIFPVLILNLISDLLPKILGNRFANIMERVELQFAILFVLLIVLMIFIPFFIQYWWGCREFESSYKVRELKEFMKDKGFRYRAMLEWPIFQGRMLTAGIMGIIPQYRYILVTESLMDILSIDELKAVIAHEMGHAKYRHMLLLSLFIIGFMIIMTITNEFVILFSFKIQYLIINLFGKDVQFRENLFYLIFAICLLTLLLVYFRYIMGLFMRHFERQADIYSAVIMGDPAWTISALEKIALLSGKIRELPSWHHFSIKQRVDYLAGMIKRPGIIKKHNRFLITGFALYLIGMAGLCYFLGFSTIKQNILFQLREGVIAQELLREPDSIPLNNELANIYNQLAKEPEAIKVYEYIIELDPNQAMAINNLAWILSTASERSLRDEKRALSLAKKAVELERSSILLDTLAEAYYVNGLYDEAVLVAEEALKRADNNKDYYVSQLNRFKYKLSN